MRKGNIKRYLTVLLIFLCLLTVGCGKKQKEKEHVNVTSMQVLIATYEAETAKMSGKVHIADQLTLEGYSGDGYVEGLEDDGDMLDFQIFVDEEGFYDLNFVSASQGGHKRNHVFVDEEKMGEIENESTEFSDAILERVYLTKGEHIISVRKYWGWIFIDRLELLSSVPIDDLIYVISPKLCNPNASDEAKRLMHYLCDVYGTNFLSGQYCENGKFGKEMVLIEKETGKYPSILGLDLTYYSPSGLEHGQTSQAITHAINYWNDGGIVTFCWHWLAPTEYQTDLWYKAFRSEATNIDLEKIMNGEDEAGYQLLLRDIDAIAEQLKVLQEEGVPILFRPLHEASGGWFWWGASGPEAYKKLYMLLYQKLVEEHKLNNLIWVWNGQDAEWYPGDDYVDIIGEDIYPGEQVVTSQIATYLRATRYSKEHKMVILSENGCLFDPDRAKFDGAMWGSFCVWNGEFVAKDTAIYALSEQYTTREMLQKVYQSDLVITLDELPDLKTYPLP